MANDQKPTRRQSVGDLMDKADGGTYKRPPVEKREQIPSQRRGPQSGPTVDR